MNLEDELLAKAKMLFGTMKPGELVNRALHELIQRESARRLASLGGCEPDATVPPRRSVQFVADGDVTYGAKKPSDS